MTHWLPHTYHTRHKRYETLYTRYMTYWIPDQRQIIRHQTHDILHATPRDHLSFRDTYHVGGSSPEVDMSVMAQCNASIIGRSGLCLYQVSLNMYSMTRLSSLNISFNTILWSLILSFNTRLWSLHPSFNIRLWSLHLSSIPDYGTFGLWGAVMAGGETVVSKRTFRWQSCQ